MESKKTQICATIPVDLIEKINKEATKENRTFSNMVAILLERAIKERERKRNGSKEVSI